MVSLNKSVILLLLFAAAAGFYCHTRPAAPAPERAIAQRLVGQVDSFSFLCREMQEIAGRGGEEGKLQALFLQARIAWKNFEWAGEYFVPASARVVNGPPVEEAEMAGQLVLEPTGLQVIEGILFPARDEGKMAETGSGKRGVEESATEKRRMAELVRQLQIVQRACETYRSHFSNIDILGGQVIDAAKLEVFRIGALGIAGFDDPLTTRNCLAECAAGMESLQPLFAGYGDTAGQQDLTRKIGAAVGFLHRDPSFESFDRATFLLDYANPVSRAITDLQNRLKIPVIRYNRLLNQDAGTVFDTSAFNVNAYAPDPASFNSTEKTALGKILFADPILSGSGGRSCRSCHQPELAFTDGLVKNTVLGDRRLLKRNTPTLLNAALQPSLFYDLRVTRLEEQSLAVVQSPEEMHGSMVQAAQRLWQDTVYRRLFAAAFPVKDRQGIDTLEVMNAIGSYVRSLTFLNSRFDAYMRGDRLALGDQEVRGFNLFMGKAKCGTCHYMPLFNGTFPPRYIKTEAEVIGVPATPAGKVLDGDPGRFGIIPVASFKHAFKTPTVRNVARTAPYMHNGVFANLDQVMDFYEKGGGTGLGIAVPNQTLPFDRLRLSRQERADIISFIRSLDSR